jgi:hypothetical protein
MITGFPVTLGGVFYQVQAAFSAYGVGGLTLDTKSHTDKVVPEEIHGKHIADHGLRAL